MQIEKVGSDPLCEMRKDSVEKKTINVAKGETAKLSFLDCPSEDLRLTASKVIGKKNKNPFLKFRKSFLFSVVAKVKDTNRLNISLKVPVNLAGLFITSLSLCSQRKIMKFIYIAHLKHNQLTKVLHRTNTASQVDK